MEEQVEEQASSSVRKASASTKRHLSSMKKKTLSETSAPQDIADIVSVPDSKDGASEQMEEEQEVAESVGASLIGHPTHCIIPEIGRAPRHPPPVLEEPSPKMVTYRVNKIYRVWVTPAFPRNGDTHYAYARNRCVPFQTTSKLPFTTPKRDSRTTEKKGILNNRATHDTNFLCSGS